MLYSTRQTAKKLGIDLRSLNRYIAAKKVSAPALRRVGGIKVRLWARRDIDKVQKLLPKITNGRKTRYQKKHSAASTQQLAKSRSKTKKQPPPRAAVPHKQARNEKS